MGEAESNVVSIEESRELVKGGAQLVDVRADHEWEAGRIEAAVHIPLPELPERAGEIDRDRPVVIVCRSGKRSAMAASALAEAGYDVTDLGAGMVGWSEAGLPMVPEDGYVADPGDAAAVLEQRRRDAKNGS